MSLGSKSKTTKEAEECIKSFKKTFCGARTRVHFLGLFDTANSVGYFESPSSRLKVPSWCPETASDIRPAIAIDKGRCGFEEALLQQDKWLANRMTEDIRGSFLV